MNTKELIEAVKNERGSAFQNCNDCEYGTHNGEVIEKLNRLAELEDKIEQGLMIELPCKVGTVLYEVIPKCKTSGLDCPYNGGYGTSRCKNGCGAYIAEQKFTFLSMRELIGKTLFLTREEAEKRLKELQE